ncbi:LacI family DNA-binding transcriptional regulator [Auraticoccus monumenti]|uniref:Transcriptional regulator, LacI family n=1 Tax=Auraticoccus monumenti TaxID=675864 RepID=A0A1G6S5E0_9ACTN|nr:LacI family DNA-binding transcriptional regulator [Auraticoccus monumenti]SDD11903.1 transcriptional regulator, LacI family [Auraticoccus monumenti]
MVTSHDVARLAGVSQPTVSRALRDSPKVSEETKERVRQAARTLGYVISETGRALASGRSRRVGLLVTDLENQFYPYAISAMHRQLESMDYQLILHTESSDGERIAERLFAHSLDGVLLATTTSDSSLPLRLKDRGVPFVYFNRTAASVEADSTTADAVNGLGELARAVLDQGHRRVAAIFGPRNTSTGEEREEALRAALELEGVTVPVALTRRGAFDVQTGYRGMGELLALRERPTVVVCSNDVVALGALNAAHELGVRVPEDVSVVGFDDLPPARWPMFSLTTVGFDLAAMARAAARLLIERVEGGETAGPFRHEVFPTSLVLRRTLGPVPTP